MLNQVFRREAPHWAGKQTRRKVVDPRYRWRQWGMTFWVQSGDISRYWDSPPPSSSRCTPRSKAWILCCEAPGSTQSITKHALTKACSTTDNQPQSHRRNVVPSFCGRVFPRRGPGCHPSHTRPKVECFDVGLWYSLDAGSRESAVVGQLPLNGPFIRWPSLACVALRPAETLRKPIRPYSICNPTTLLS